MLTPRIFGILLVTACSTSPAQGPSRPALRDPERSLPHFPESKGERLRSRTLDLPIELLLPEKASWRVTDGPIWLEAEQAESSSKFAFRTWRAERLVRRTDCASQARLARSTIPIARDETVIEQRPFQAPLGFDSELVVGVEPSAHGVEGFAIVFGASIGYCYAAMFTTTATGAGAEQEVATRLGIAVDRVLSSVRTRSVDERAVRRRLVVIPKAPSSTPNSSK